MERRTKRNHLQIHKTNHPPWFQVSVLFLYCGVTQQVASCMRVCLSQTVCFSLSVLVCLSVSLSYSSVPIWEIDLQGSTLSSPSHLFPLARCMLNRDPLRQVSYRESLSGPESIPNRGSTFALDGSTRRGRKVQGHFWRRVA